MGSALGTREVVAAGENREDGEVGEGVEWGRRGLNLGEEGGAVSPERLLLTDWAGSVGLVIRARGNFFCRSNSNSVCNGMYNLATAVSMN